MEPEELNVVVELLERSFGDYKVLERITVPIIEGYAHVEKNLLARHEGPVDVRVRFEKAGTLPRK